MNRQQKRAKRMRAREAQKRHRRTRVETHGKHTIQVQGGPKPTPSFHKTDPPKHGRRLDARGQAIAELEEIGIVEPSDDLIREYQRSKRVQGGSKARAQDTAKKAVKAMNAGLKRAGEAVDAIQTAKPGQQVVATEDEIRVEDKPNAGTEIKLDEPSRPSSFRGDVMPGQQHWDEELEPAAKKRRRGAKSYVKVLTDAGFELVDGGDPKMRESWRRSDP